LKSNGWVPYPRYIFRKEIALSWIEKEVVRESRFLEVGCAAGDFGITLAKKGYKGLIIDFSDDAAHETIRTFEDEKITSIQFEKKDFFDIHGGEKFDLITMFEVLEHISDDGKALKRVHGLLDKEGKFLFSVPSKASLWGANDDLAGHLRRYEKTELVNLLSQSGFDVLRFASYGFPWLNMIKWVRDKMASKRLKENSQKSLKALTEKSGLNISGRVPLLEVFFNKYFLFLPMRVNSLFNNMNLAEGYLVLAKKK